MTSKSKAKDALPLKGIVATKERKKEVKDSEKVREGASSSLEDVLGTRKERRECAVGVRVTRAMKEVLEELSAKTRLSESEIVYRILKKNLDLEDYSPSQMN